MNESIILISFTGNSFDVVIESKLVVNGDPLTLTEATYNIIQ